MHHDGVANNFPAIKKKKKKIPQQQYFDTLFNAISQ